MGLANRLLMLACLAGCRCRPAGPSPCPFVNTLLTRHPIVRPPRSPHGPLDPCPAHLLAATNSAPPSLRARRALRALLGAALITFRRARCTMQVRACRSAPQACRGAGITHAWLPPPAGQLALSILAPSECDSSRHRPLRGRHELGEENQRTFFLFLKKGSGCSGGINPRGDR